MIIYRNLATVLVMGMMLGGCASLQDISLGVCGNGVVEDDEDCDSLALDGLACGTTTDPPPQQCHYKCGPENKTVCPAGWGCSREGVCQHGQGLFVEGQGSPLSLNGEVYQFGDLDGDSTTDLIAFSESEVHMRYGAGNGQFTTHFDVATPSLGGPVRFARLDSDAAEDGLLPLELGLVVAVGRADRTLAPVPTVVDLEAVSMLPFPDAARAQLVALPSGGPIAPSRALVFIGDLMPEVPRQLEVFSPEIPGMPVALPSAPGIREVARLTPPHTANVDTDPARDGGDFAFAFEGDTVAFVYGLVGTAVVPVLEERDVIPLPPGLTVHAGTLFGDVDGDDRLDLIISTHDGSGLERVVVAPGLGDGKFAPATVSARFDNLLADCQDQAMGGMGDAQACSRFPLAAGDLDGDRVADYLTANAIHMSLPGNVFLATTRRMSPVPWTEAVIGDFNNDGAGDVAAVSGMEDGIDFFMGNDSGYFTPVRIFTAGTPYSLRVGDFDGDFVGDLAFAEHVGADATISIVFGESLGLPLTAITMGQFENINYCEVGRLSDPADLIDELVIDTTTQGGGVSISQFFGTSQRRMVSPLFFARDPTRPQDRGQVLMAEPGRFLAASGNGGSVDIAVLTRTRDSLDLWLLQDGTSGVNPDIANQVKAPMIGASFDLGCGLWTAGDVDGDGLDELVSVDRTRGCRGNTGTQSSRLLIVDIFPNVSGGLEGFDKTTKVVALAGDRTAPHSIELVDLDEDGQLDLLVAFTGKIDPNVDCGSGGGSGVIVYWGDGGTFAMNTEVPGLEPGDVPAVTLANTDDDPQRELLIWTKKGIVIGELDRASRTFTTSAAGVSSSTMCVSQILARDLDRDQIDDLVIADRSNVEIHLAVPHTQP